MRAGRGGWLYRGALRPEYAVAHGYNEYGQDLVKAGVIIPLDEHGNRVDRAKGIHTTTVRSYRMWRSLAHHFELSEPAAARGGRAPGGN